MSVGSVCWALEGSKKVPSLLAVDEEMTECVLIPAVPVGAACQKQPVLLSKPFKALSKPLFYVGPKGSILGVQLPRKPGHKPEHRPSWDGPMNRYHPPLVQLEWRQ